MKTTIRNLKKFVSIATIYFCIGSSCKSVGQQLKCFEEKQNEIQSAPIYRTLYTTANDTVKNWIRMKIKSAGIPPLSTFLDWKIDSGCFLNSN